MPKFLDFLWHYKLSAYTLIFFPDCFVRTNIKNIYHFGPWFQKIDLDFELYLVLYQDYTDLATVFEFAFTIKAVYIWIFKASVWVWVCVCGCVGGGESMTEQMITF